MALPLSDVEEEELRSAFSLFDRDESNSITVKELRETVKLKDLMAMVAEADKKRNETIHFEEFAAILNKPPAESPSGVDEELRAAFSGFLPAGSSQITLPSLKQALELLGENVVDEELENLFKEADANNDGLLDFDEFRKILQ